MTRRGPVTSSILAGVVALAAARAEAQEGGKPETTNSRVCAPGIQISCPCPGGAAPGTQVCDDDGARYSPCACAAPPVAPVVLSTRGDCLGTSPPPKPEVRYEHANLPLMIGGIVLLSVGIVTTVTGAALYKIDEDKRVTPAAGIILSAIGGFITLAAPASIILGAIKVPVTPRKGRGAQVVMEPSLTGLRFTF